ncbi:hypothetical protein GE09DRAFT_591977 [Coniochaeta sp. 2T2.1]|nr:hypothetical protein GE09DRAFT_591977 [Coniochaeta sp. 2T2.1]
MAPKVPPKQELAAELAKTVRAMYAAGERDDLTVNIVRERTSEKLGLDVAFFKDGEWKTESKQIIKQAVDDIENEPEPASSPVATPKKAANSRKRAADAADENTPPAKKRQVAKPAPKTKPAPKRPAKKAAKKPESELSELDDSDVSEKPKKRQRLAKRGKKTVTSESEDEEHEPEDDSAEDTAEDTAEEGDAMETSESEAAPQKKAAPKKPAQKRPAQKKEATKKLEEADATATDSPLSEPEDVESERQEEVKVSPPPDKQDKEKKPSLAADESSESEVFDEPPKLKRKFKSKEPSTKASGKSAKAKPGKAKATADLSPDAAEIKKLQGQLVKCGVRKIWGIELKPYGDDSRAKIRHLKDMLKEVGMDGRFSESKAREIKERRELLADLEAVNEMNENLDWGSGGGRTSRSRAARPKSLAVDVSDDDEDTDGNGDAGKTKDTDSGDENEDDEPHNPRARAIAKRRADFAFLGDDEESD